jgi:UTP--glucose-1-phosphate uridylyltransferase
MKNNIINKCLFPAAGYGTRFLPATKAIPKEMLPLVTKPLIQYGVEEAIEAGCDTMCMVISKYKKAIEDHFDTNTDIQNSIKGSSKEQLLDNLNHTIKTTTFSYTKQLEMKGLGDAILTGQTLIGNEPFAVILADDVCTSKNDAVLTQMVEIYKKYPNKCIVAIEPIEKKDTKKYGVISGELIENNIYRVDNMVEKPEPQDAPSNLAIIGRYILIPEIFDIIKDTKAGIGAEIQITDALLTLAKQGKVLAYQFDGKRFDCGSIDGFVEATNYFYTKQ